MANTYVELKQYDEAENMLRKVIFYLLYLEEFKVLNNNMIHSELKKASLAYSNFIDKNNMTKSRQEKTLKNLKDRFVNN